jgi:hypothetical protein
MNRSVMGLGLRLLGLLLLCVGTTAEAQVPADADARMVQYARRRRAGRRGLRVVDHPSAEAAAEHAAPELSQRRLTAMIVAAQVMKEP